MGFSIETGISAFTVFMQGLLSFFSPCVLPLVPLYLGYLSGGLNTAVRTGENSEKNKDRLKLFLRVLFFTVGIGSAFFILGLVGSEMCIRDSFLYSVWARRRPEVSSMSRGCCLPESGEY